MLTAIQKGFGESYDCSSQYAMPFLKKFMEVTGQGKPQGDNFTFQYNGTPYEYKKGDPLPSGLGRVLIT
eukprot:4832439-Prymnesium_polylepis.1